MRPLARHSGSLVGRCHEVCTTPPLVRRPAPAADLTIKRTPPRHQRVPSHEALLKVYKQHKVALPPDEQLLPTVLSGEVALPSPLPPPAAAPAPAAPQQPLAARQASVAVLGAPSAGNFLGQATAVPAAVAASSGTAQPPQPPEQQEQQQALPSSSGAGVPGGSAPGSARPSSGSEAVVERSASGSSRSSSGSKEAPGLDPAALERQRAAEALYGEK